MAKGQVKEREESSTGTDVAKATTSLPAELTNALDEHAGEGVSHRMEDNIVPLVYLLQANSKPALKGHEKYVKGAEGGGKIWLRNEPIDDCLVDGEEGMVFLPCHFSVCWIEWMPDRGGFVARHPERPREATLQDVANDKGDVRKAWVMPSGNLVQESREFAGFALREGRDAKPYTIPMSGTNHTIGRQWMTTMRDERLPSGKPAPLYANLYRVRTKLKTRGENSWFLYDVTKEGSLVDDRDAKKLGLSVEQRTGLVKAGMDLFSAFETGLKKSAAVEDTGEPTEDTGGREVDEK